MPDVAAADGAASSGRWSLVGLAFALAAAAVWVVAGVADDGLYTLAGALGIAGFAAGTKARRETSPAAGPRWPALAGIVLGGLIGGAVLVTFAGWGIYQLVS